jgi:hypothetical protein
MPSGGQDGLEAKASRLQVGDLIVIRTTEKHRRKVRILGCCRVLGPMQRDHTRLWPGSGEIFPLRVRVDFNVKQPQEFTDWKEWQALGLLNRDGQPMKYRDALGAFFKENFIDEPAQVARVCKL